MRNIWLDGAAVTAAIVVSWSMATFAKPKMASRVNAAAASVAISPLVMMAQQRGDLAIEYWTNP
jgi:hypothetical protein